MAPTEFKRPILTALQTVPVPTEAAAQILFRVVPRTMKIGRCLLARC